MEKNQLIEINLANLSECHRERETLKEILEKYSQEPQTREIIQTTIDELDVEIASINEFLKENAVLIP